MGGVLLEGPRGCGKTSTGLHDGSEGWEFESLRARSCEDLIGAGFIAIRACHLNIREPGTDSEIGKVLALE